MQANLQAWVVRALVVGVVAAATLVGSGAPAHACSCVEPRAGLRAASAVFVARVVESDRSPDVGGPLAGILVHHRVEVGSVYRGRVPQQTTVQSYGGHCGPALADGRSYLIASSGHGRGAPYQSGLCSGTEPLGPAARAEARAAFGAPYEPVLSPTPDRTDGASDLDPPAEVVWFPGPVWLYPLAGAVVVGGVALSVWRWRRARS
ncbi:MAG: hypothetical protein M3353_09710 [Actinomycetota bacterium]|nr:hypothetical protein [Actinomycetota bacterium]